MDKVIYFNTMTEPNGGVYSAPVIILIIVLAAMVLLIVGMIFGVINSIKNTTIALTEKELIIKTTFYGRKIPIENIFVNEIRAINLNVETDYAISRRTNGMSLPNMNVGWMRLKNGMKSLALITDKESVVLIPTKDFVVLFSMNNIDEFIAGIRK